MEALVFYDKGDIRYEKNWPNPPKPDPGFVTVEVAWCGICGSDLEDYEVGAVMPTKAPHPVSGKITPLVLGHEYSGVVKELGKGVTNVKVGDRVAIECVRSCGTCYWCKRQQFAACDKMVSVGQQDNGGMAEYLNIEAENCIPIPDSMSLEEAALAEPLAVMVRAMRKARLTVGETVAVVGAGPIGLAAIAAARACGAYRVIAIAHGGRRADVAKQVGAHYVLNSRDEGWKQRYYELTDGMGAQVVFDTGGNVNSVRLSLEITRRLGRCVFGSVMDMDVPLPGLDILLNEKEIIGTVAHSYNEEFLWAVQYMADGRIDLKPMITRYVHVSNALEDGIHALQKDRNQIKILVTAKRALLEGK